MQTCHSPPWQRLAWMPSFAFNNIDLSFFYFHHLRSLIPYEKPILTLSSKNQLICHCLLPAWNKRTVFSCLLEQKPHGITHCPQSNAYLNDEIPKWMSYVVWKRWSIFWFVLNLREIKKLWDCNRFTITVDQQACIKRELPYICQSP